jgi:hypothetical protein
VKIETDDSSMIVEQRNEDSKMSRNRSDAIDGKKQAEDALVLSTRDYSKPSTENDEKNAPHRNSEEVKDEERDVS